MIRFACFVDFSNLMGSLSKINLRVKDYQQFFKHIADESYKQVMESTMISKSHPEASISRIYWYALGNHDYWDFRKQNTIDYFSRLFDSNHEIKKHFMSELGKQSQTQDQSELYRKALQAFIDDRKIWYEERAKNIQGYRGFYEKVRRESDFIDINESGHLKLNFIAKEAEEKGVDTALAVDSVTMIDTYDVALIISGDADMIPSINYLKKHGKHVGVVSFIGGYPPESRGKQQSQRLSRAADFDIQIYEMDLIRLSLAEVGMASDGIL